MQADGVTCFPCSSPDGFLGSLFNRFRKDDTAYGRVHLQAHPVVSTALAQFFQDAVLYATTQCMIETLTLGPRECRPPLRDMMELNKTPWMNYWKLSPANRLGLTDKDIQDEIRWQENALQMNAEEGCYLSNRVHSTAGRTANMLTIHALSARQFSNSSVRAGMNVTVLDAAINAERRDRQTEQDQMMVREFKQQLFFVGQNKAFRDDVLGGKPIVIPGGEAVNMADYEIPEAPEPVEEPQVPPVEAWPAASSTGYEDKPPPPPPASSAPAASEVREPPPPPPNRPTNKQPNAERRSRWRREIMKVRLLGTKSTWRVLQS